MAKIRKIKQQDIERCMRIVYCAIVISVFSSFSSPPGKSYRLKTIVIDAGHGGHDTGCLGSSSKEKTVSLNIALKLGKLLEENFPDLNVIFTRTTDVFIGLQDRAEIANKAHADLFICIHCNSGPKSAFGVETFVMGLHKTEDNLTVSMRENSSILLEKDYRQKYDGYDPNSPESFIIFNLYQNAYMEKSLMFASKIQYQVDVFANRYSRGVKQAGFLVLYKTAMPSVLVESGFLTNATEEKFLNTDKGQTNVAITIFRAFKEYKVDVEQGDSSQPDNLERKEPETKTIEKSIKKEAKEIVKVKTEKDTTTVKTPATKEKIATTGIDSAKLVQTKVTSGVDSSAIYPGKNQAAATKEKPALPKDSVKMKPDSNTVAIKEPSKKTEIKEQEVSAELFFTIQIGASATYNAAEKKKYSVGGMNIIKAEGMNRFTIGHYASVDEAAKKLSEVKQMGFPDAFITPYHIGKRITLSEAKKLRK